MNSETRHHRHAHAGNDDVFAPAHAGGSIRRRQCDPGRCGRRHAFRGNRCREYPVEAVQTMDRIARAIEEIFPYEEMAYALAQDFGADGKRRNRNFGCANRAHASERKKTIVAFTETGGTAKRMCKFRPCVPIIAVADNLETCRRLSYYFGVIATYHEVVTDILLFNPVAMAIAKSFGLKEGDTIIITHGWAQEHGTTNNMSVINIE